MLTVVILIVAIFALIAILEVLNAIFMAFLRGFLEGLNVKEPSAAVAFLMLPSMVFSLLLRGAVFVSLIVHESAHALFQTLGFGKPRIVLCSNGGFAQGRPWSRSPLFAIPYSFGQWMLQGFTTMAPVIVASTLAYLTLHTLAHLDLAEVAAKLADAEVLSASLKTLPKSVWSLASYLLATLRGLPTWKLAVFALVGIMLSPGMTASSVDFYHGRYPLVGYAVSVTSAAVILSKAPVPGLVLLAVGFGATALFMAVQAEEREWPMLLSSFGLTQMLLGVLTLLGVFTPSLLELTRMLSASVLGLTLAALVLVPFIGLMVVLSLLTLQLRPIGLMLKRTPEELLSIFKVFSTCGDCAMHFRGKCDGCGRTIQEIEAKEKAGQEHSDLSAAAQEMMQRVQQNVGAKVEAAKPDEGAMLDRLKARAQLVARDGGESCKPEGLRAGSAQQLVARDGGESCKPEGLRAGSAQQHPSDPADEGSIVERMRARAKARVED